MDAAGNVIVANTLDHTICQITPAGSLTVLAGRPGCPGSTDGPGSNARFSYPQGVAVDAAGNIYVADAGNCTIRRITPSGMVTTLAGLAGHDGSADGTGAEAQFDFPKGIAVDGFGNVYVADLYNSTIRKVTPSGVVTTLAGQAECPGCVDGKGCFARFDAPVAVAVDNADNVYVVDLNDSSIRRITPTGVVTTLTRPGSYCAGDADGFSENVLFKHPYGLAVDNAGNVYVADAGNSTIRRLTPAGIVTTLGGLAGTAGNEDGLGSAARFSCPAGIALDRTGNLYVVDSGNAQIRKGTFGPTSIRGMAGGGLSSITQ